jgi:hypothetical protein
MTSGPTTVAKLNELAAAIRRYDDPRRASGEWGQVYRLLQKTALPAGRVADVVGMRDVEGLAAMIGELQNPASAVAPDAPSSDTCRNAMQAFRKRLSLMELDEQSKLGRNPLTKGVRSSIAGIAPPREWPESVWQELVRQGKLRYVGRGLYDLAKP